MKDTQLHDLIAETARRKLSHDIMTDINSLALKLPVRILKKWFGRFTTEDHQLETMLSNRWHEIVKLMEEHFLPIYIERETRLFYDKVMSK
jgi:hypothetical protein